MKTKSDSVVYSDTKKVKCSGTEDGLGHPLIYLTIKLDKITCPYCSKEFFYKNQLDENNLKVK
jgi:uncharacterized Zn-finger protein